MVLPPNYPYNERKLCFVDWSSPFRHERIDEVLSRLHKVSIDDSLRLQCDFVSIPAQRLVALLRPLSGGDANTRAALALLRGWNGDEDAGSTQAALYEVWYSRYLRAAVKRAILSKAAADAFGTPDVMVVMDTLQDPQSRFGENGTEKRNQLLLGTLGEAYAELERLEGQDPSQWKWGKLHYNLSEHPFAPLVGKATVAKLDVGPFPTGGDAFTVDASGYRASDFRQTTGPSVRWVVDVGNWDNTRIVNLPGQSGDPDSPHYRDLASMWFKGQYFPLLYSRKAVVRATERRILLVPKLGKQ